MSQRRKMQRSHREARLAGHIGNAIADYGRSGGSLPQLAEHLARYAAQCFIMGTDTPVIEDFVTMTDRAYRVELASLLEKAEKTGKG